MTGDEPPYLSVGTEVSAKYRGAFCEAKVKKLVRSVKCKVILKESQIPMMVTDDKVKGVLKIGEVVELQDPDSGQPVEGTISKLTDSSMYTVVFDDGDERTLRRSQLCLKGEKHFIESETLDNLPLSHPEHFGTPVMHGKKSKRGRYSGGGVEDETDETSSEDGVPKRASYKGRLQELVGKVMVVDIGDKRKQTVPVLVVLPDAQPPDPKKKDNILVRSFKDGKFVYAQRKELKDFTRDVAIKNEDKNLKSALEKALLYYDNQDLPLNWDHDELLGTDEDEDFNEEESSDDEPNEEKDCFVAQLYKFMDDRGTPINKAPAIVNKDLNLYRLFKVVQNIGGYNKVTNQMKWRMVYSKMNLPPINTASHQIKNAYKKYLHAFEDFYRKLGSSMGTISRPGRSRHNSGRGMVQFRGREREAKDEKDSEGVSEEGKDEKVKDLEGTPSKERHTPKRVTRQDVSEEATKKDTETKKSTKKEDQEETKKKVNKKDDNENKKEPESKKNQKKEETEAKKNKEDDIKKGKDESDKKEKEDKKKEDEKKVSKKDEVTGKKTVKSEEGKKEKKEDVIMKKAKVVVKKDDAKVKKEIENENNDKKTVNPSLKNTPQTVDKKSQNNEKKTSASSAEKKSALQTAEKKPPQKVDKAPAPQVTDKKPTPQKTDKTPIPQVTDKKPTPQKVDKTPTPQVTDKKPAPQKLDKTPTPQTAEKKLTAQATEKKVNQAGEKAKITPKTETENKVKSSPKKLIRRRSLRKDEGKEEVNIISSPKVIIQKEVKVNLGKKDLKQEIVKKIKKKVEGQTDDKEKKSVTHKDARNCPLGTRLKVKYGGGKTEKIYDAKVVESQDDGSGLRYLVHYAGWNNRYDEWIQPDRIVNIVERPPVDIVVKKIEKKPKENTTPKTPKSSTLQPTLTPQQQVMKKRPRSGPSESPSSSPARSEKARSPASSVVGSDKKKSRPTRSNSVEFKGLEGLQVKQKRTRRNSGLTESSDIISHASFTDDTDNSDEETDKAEDLSDSQSEPSKPVMSDSESKSKEDPAETEEKSNIDFVEVKVLIETASNMDYVVDVKPIDENCEIAMPKIEPDIIPTTEEEKLVESTNTDTAESAKVSDQEDEKTSEPPEEKSSDTEVLKTEEIIIDNQVDEEKKENEDIVDIKCNEDSSSLDKFEFKDDEEEISLPEWKTEKQVDEDWKPRERGRPRKSQIKTETKKEQPPKEKKEVKKTKMTMAERKYMGQNPPFSEMEPPMKKTKEEEIIEKLEVKDTNDEDTEEDNEMEKKKVKKKTKKKEAVDSDSSDIDHKKVVKKDTKASSKPVTKSKKRLKDVEELERRSLMSDDDSSVTSEKCDTDNTLSDQTPKSVITNQSSAVMIEISEQNHSASGTFVNTPPTSPEQDTCVSQQHSNDALKNITAEQTPLESLPGNASPSSNDGSIGSGNVAGSDSSDVVNLGKRKKEVEENFPAKKKKRGKSKSIGEKKSKPNGSDSDENCNQTSGSSSPTKSRPRSPRTPKYNLNLDEGKYLEGEQRISFLMDKAQEIRKIYMDLKAEVALIDRRRKRAKRKERDSGHAVEINL